MTNVKRTGSVPHAEELRRALEGAERVRILGHDIPDADALISALLTRDLLAAWGISARIVCPTPPDAQTARILSGMGYEPDGWRGETEPGDALVLCDHHRTAHAGHVLGVIDHHPTEVTQDAPFVRIERRGACAALVLEMMQEAGRCPTRAQTALAVTALYLDTMALRSAKITSEEAEWARMQAHTLGLDIQMLTREGLGLEDLRQPVKTLAQRGFKRFIYGDRVVCSSYVQTDAMTPALLTQILDRCGHEREENGAVLWVFLLHDPMAGRSVEWDLYADGREMTTEYDHLVSRGQEIMPRVEREMRAYARMPKETV